MAFMMTSIASLFDFNSGAKPPSSPTAVESPRFLSIAFRLWNISTPARSDSLNDVKPAGTA